MRFHDSNEPKIYACLMPKCKFTTGGRKAIRQHLKEKHKIRKSLWRYYVALPISLKEHVKEIVKEIKKKLHGKEEKGEKEEKRERNKIITRILEKYK